MRAGHLPTKVNKFEEISLRGFSGCVIDYEVTETNRHD